jgi:hypothetical protein
MAGRQHGVPGERIRPRRDVCRCPAGPVAVRQRHDARHPHVGGRQRGDSRVALRQLGHQDQAVPFQFSTEPSAAIARSPRADMHCPFRTLEHASRPAPPTHPM